MKPKPILTFWLDHFDGAGHEYKYLIDVRLNIITFVAFGPSY